MGKRSVVMPAHWEAVYTNGAPPASPSPSTRGADLATPRRRWRRRRWVRWGRDTLSERP